jgi:hypothetical protein
LADQDIDTNLGMSRRTLIKRGAILGGLVWAAPSITSVASAAVEQPGSRPCKCYSFVVIDPATIYKCYASDTSNCLAYCQCVSSQAPPAGGSFTALGCVLAGPLFCQQVTSIS